MSERLRGLSAPRLAQQVPGYATRAVAGRAAARLLADLAAGVEGRESDTPPLWRLLPSLHDLAVGDQIAVTCADAVAAVAALADSPSGAGEPIWTHAGRRSAAEAAEAVLAELREIRLAID